MQGLLFRCAWTVIKTSVGNPVPPVNSICLVLLALTSFRLYLTLHVISTISHSILSAEVASCASPGNPGHLSLTKSRLHGRSSPLLSSKPSLSLEINQIKAVVHQYWSDGINGRDKYPQHTHGDDHEPEYYQSQLGLLLSNDHGSALSRIPAVNHQRHDPMKNASPGLLPPTPCAFSFRNS
jgi:hypothetical protein